MKLIRSYEDASLCSFFFYARKEKNKVEKLQCFVFCVAVLRSRRRDNLRNSSIV